MSHPHTDGPFDDDGALSDADRCRALGWGPGTVLVGDEGYGPTVIEITAVGAERIMARQISHSAKPGDGVERSWTLRLRDWRPLPAGDPAWDLVSTLWVGWDYETDPHVDDEIVEVLAEVHSAALAFADVVGQVSLTVDVGGVAVRFRGERVGTGAVVGCERQVAATPG